MTYRDIHDQHLRLSILRLLEKEGDYRANDSLLTAAVEPLGFKVSRDKMRAQLAWLSEQGLVTLEAVGHLSVVMITERGIDVALGRATAPGVQRPAPPG